MRGVGGETKVVSSLLLHCRDLREEEEKNSLVSCSAGLMFKKR